MKFHFRFKINIVIVKEIKFLHYYENYEVREIMIIQMSALMVLILCLFIKINIQSMICVAID